MATAYTKTNVNLIRNRGWVKVKEEWGISGIHWHNDTVDISMLHTWKRPNGKIKEYYSLKQRQTFEIPEGLITHSERFETRMASRYFQTDDMYYTEIVKTKSVSYQMKVELIEMFHNKTLIKHEKIS